MKSFYFLLFSLFTITSFSQSYFQTLPESSYVANRNSVATQIVATIPYQGYDEVQSYFGEGEYEIFIDTVDGILDNPIIVLDGFDPGDSRDIGGLYNSLNFDGDNLADILRSEGFDIVVLNAPLYSTDGKDIDGGADYIQRNAMVLIELIDFLNNEKVGEEELVVLGPSMGGLIARYGLAFMEQNGMFHETRLYISFDSPHRGANIPVSLQYLINYLAQEIGDPDALAIVEGVLNSPAAKEMLVDHLLGHLLAGSTYLQDPSLLLPIGAPDFREAFQTELDALGFPEQVRNVTMINGSGQGETTGTAGMQVVDTNLDLGNFITADVILHFTPIASQTNNVTTFESFIAGFPLDLFEADAESFSTTDGVDSSPGGTSNISSALGGAGGGNPVIQAFIDALDQDDFSFIPAISALAIDNEEDWFAIPDIGGIHNSEFANTYIPDENEPHVTVTQESADFALDEIRNPVLDITEVDINNRYFLVRNPVSHEIEIRLNASLNYSNIELVVYAISGQQLIHQEIQHADREISIPHSLSAGMYLLNIQDNDGSYSLKFVVK
jgi:hypothetical protein